VLVICELVKELPVITFLSIGDDHFADTTQVLLMVEPESLISFPVVPSNIAIPVSTAEAGHTTSHVPHVGNSTFFRFHESEVSDMIK
jgi:hypothetical protein